MNDFRSESEFLKKYDANEYESPSVTVDTVVFSMNKKKNENYRKLPQTTLQVLLVKRKEYPEKEKWSIPGGFVGIGETLVESASKMLMEKTGLQDVYMEQLYTWGDIERDPRKRVISASYLSLINKDSVSVATIKPVLDAEWFDVSLKTVDTVQHDNQHDTHMILKLENTESNIVFDTRIIYSKTIRNGLIETNIEVVGENHLAFDHAKILAYAIVRLRNRLEYSGIAMHMMPPEFSFGELQQVYECILDKEFIGPNFRRKMASFVDEVPCDEKVAKKSGHRPAKLIKFNTERLLAEL